MAFKDTGSGGGETQWTGGTGKYTGLKGRGTHQQTVAGMGIGWSVWKGDWELPSDGWLTGMPGLMSTGRIKTMAVCEGLHGGTTLSRSSYPGTFSCSTSKSGRRS